MGRVKSKEWRERLITTPVSVWPLREDGVSLCDWSTASTPASDWLARLTMWRLLDSVLSTSLNATLQDLASSQCASLSHNNNKLQSPETSPYITQELTLEEDQESECMDQNFY